LPHTLLGTIKCAAEENGVNRVKTVWAIAMLATICCGALLAQQIEGDNLDFHPFIDISAAVPWTAVPLVTHPDFRFTIFSDRTGMAYPGAMERAIQYVNQQLSGNDKTGPDLVLSVGDNIEGYSRDAAGVGRMWSAFDAIIAPLRVPFFRLPGNHDISDPVMEQVYLSRYGSTYYAFEIQHVLFLSVDTEDGPPVLTPERELEIHRILERAESEGVLHPDKPVELPGQKDPCNAETTHADLGSLAETHISAAQLNYFRKVLADQPDIRQTIILMHRPAWRNPTSPAFTELQELLHGRKYTVFAGHYHQYSHEVIDGSDYYILGPTGALPRCVRNRDFLNQVLEVQVAGDRLITHRVMLTDNKNADTHN
jgi:serine/threonine-protein phosphatase CPPED1